MSALFIIGNGFDLAHELPTKYLHFREYLKNTYPESEEVTPTIEIGPIFMPDGSINYDDNEVVSLLIQAVDKVSNYDPTWQEFESYLGYLDFGEYFGFISDIHDRGRDPNPSHKYNSEEDFGNILLDTVPTIKELFSDWVNTIDIQKTSAKDEFLNLIDYKNDKFINFNYTNVLEEIYNVDEQHVWHPHGNIDSEIIVGHGNIEYEASDIYFGAMGSLNQIHDALLKNTYLIIEENEERFDSLTNITDIYSYGFSFSKVDLPYVKKICDSVDTDKVTWYLNDYDELERRNEIQEVIEKKCNFNGNFSTFTI